MKILDCTLRDGGYYNNWDFHPDLVRSYLESVASSGIDFVELGLRNFSKEGFFGAFAYSNEHFLIRLNLPKGPKYGVMVDAKTIIQSEMSVSDAVNNLFVERDVSQIDLVRVAAHFHEVEDCEEIVFELKKKGYLVGLNLMQTGGKDTSILAETAEIAQRWEGLDVLYFADSLGNMDGKEVLRVINALRLHWTGELGIHTHNNMGKALDNCLVAKDAGVTWLDATITGMGRGAGNAETEKLLAVQARLSEKYSAASVYELAIRYFEPMQKVSGWGSNLLYFIGAQNEVHPTYIQNLLSDTHYGTDEIIGAIDYLGNLENSSSYNSKVYKAALSFGNANNPISGSLDLVDKALGKQILIVANGPNLNRYIDDIRDYIDDNKPIVIAINAIEVLEGRVDYYCISRNSKFLSEGAKYSKLAASIILPLHRFSKSELSSFSDNAIFFDYGLEVICDEFEAKSTECKIPFDITAAYAFAAAKVMSGVNIKLVGFDGYEKGDERQLEMIELVSAIKNASGLDNITALTPTTYPIKQGSIYAPTR